MPESEEELAARQAQRKRVRQYRWIGYVIGVPATGIMALGYEWGALTTAMATCSLVSLALVTIGLFASMTVACEW